MVKIRVYRTRSLQAVGVHWQLHVHITVLLELT